MSMQQLSVLTTSKAQCTFVHGRAGEYKGALNGGGALPVAGGVGTELPVSTEPKRVHLSRRGREGQCVLPCRCRIEELLSLRASRLNPSTSTQSLTDWQLMLVVCSFMTYSIY